MENHMEYSNIKDPFIKECPYCHQTNFYELRPDASKFYLSHKNIKQSKMIYVICENCGSVVRTYLSQEDINNRKEDTE